MQEEEVGNDRGSDGLSRSSTESIQAYIQSVHEGSNERPWFKNNLRGSTHKAAVVLSNCPPDVATDTDEVGEDEDHTSSIARAHGDPSKSVSRVRSSDLQTKLYQNKLLNPRTRMATPVN